MHPPAKKNAARLQPLTAKAAKGGMQLSGVSVASTWVFGELLETQDNLQRSEVKELYAPIDDFLGFPEEPAPGSVARFV